MAKKNAEVTYDIATLQPDELNALRASVKEFVTRVENIDNEIALLRDDKKELIEEFKEKLDVATLNAALRVLKIQSEVKHRDTFDLFVSALTDGAE